MVILRLGHLWDMVPQTWDAQVWGIPGWPPTLGAFAVGSPNETKGPNSEMI